MTGLEHAADLLDTGSGQLVDAYLDWLAGEVRAGRHAPAHGSDVLDDAERVTEEARRWWAARHNRPIPRG